VYYTVPLSKTPSDSELMESRAERWASGGGRGQQPETPPENRLAAGQRKSLRFSKDEVLGRDRHWPATLPWRPGLYVLLSFLWFFVHAGDRIEIEMNVWRLIRREIHHRRLNFGLAALSVMVAVGVLVAAVVLLRSHDLRTEQLLKFKQEEADRQLAKMEDDYRKYMKELGYNLLILPRQQDLTEFLQSGYATHTMPEEDVEKLAASGTTLIRHLLPIVQQQVRWTEKERVITLIGTRGEVPIRTRAPREPMLEAVPRGRAVVGYRLAADLGIEPGQRFALLGAEFEVLSVRPRRGGTEDTCVWLNLADAQRLLGLKGRINGIEALKCHCASDEGTTLDDEIANLERAITTVLPDTQILLRENRVTVRAKARGRAKRVRVETLAKWERDRADLRGARETFAAFLVPLVILGGAAWIAFLAMGNVRERRSEIGILRAIGVRSAQVLAVFLGKATLVGLVGAVAGCAAGIAVGAVAAQITEGAFSPRAVAIPWVFLVILVVAPVLAGVASLVPAMAAAAHDPAVVLRED